MTTTEVENFPGFRDGIMGPDLMDEMREQAKRFGADIRTEDVDAIDLNGPIKKVTVGDQTYQAHAVILAMGSAARYLNVPGEQRLLGRGVSACATCDGFFFKGQDIVVVGGGDSAMEEAIFLTKFASSVTIVHRREEFRASRIMLERARANEKIEFVLNSEVLEVHGENSVTHLTLRDTRTGEISNWPRPACSWRSATIRVASWSRARSSWTTRATCRCCTRRPPPMCLAFLPRATSSTTPTVRRSPPRGPAAARLSMPSAGSPNMATSPRTASRTRATRFPYPPTELPSRFTARREFMAESAKTVTVTDASFADDVLLSEKPVLVDFWADWCGPCKMVAPVLEEIAGTHADKLTIAKLDVDANPGTARDYQILSLPTMMLFRGGKPVKQIVGAKGKAALLRELEGVI